MDFFRLEDAQQRLQGSVLRVNQTPVWVLGVRTSETVRKGYDIFIRFLTNGKDTWIPLDSSIDFSPVTLGNTNYQGSSYYLSRTPARMWKQGLANENLEITSTTKPRQRNGIDVTSRCVVDTILGRYPSFKEAFSNVFYERASSVAFSRNFSLSTTGLVFNSRVIVGNYRGKDIQLHDSYFFLKEMLDEALVK